MEKYISIDIGGSHVLLTILLEKENSVVIEKSESIYYGDSSKKEKLDIVLQEVRRYLGENYSSNKILICAPGNIYQGRLLNAKNISDEEIDLKKIITKYGKENNRKIETHIINDAEAAAFAEIYNGSLNKNEDSIYIGIGTGIGFAYIAKGRIIKFAKQNITVSHIDMGLGKETEKICECGKRNCIEKFLSIRALDDKIKIEIAQIEEKQIPVEKKEEIMNLRVYEILNDPKVVEYLNENIGLEDILKIYAQNFVKMLVNLTEMFLPSQICIGGSFTKLKQTKLYMNICEKFKNEKFYALKNPPKVSIASNISSAGILGNYYSYKLNEQKINKLFKNGKSKSIYG